MAKSKPLMAKSSGTDVNGGDPIGACARSMPASAVIGAVTAALQGPLGPAFAETVDIIRKAKGRVIVTGLGKSGHVARKIAATLASTGTPAFFVHAAEASHGDLGMITPDDVIIALSWSGEQPEMKNLVNYSKPLCDSDDRGDFERNVLARRGRADRAGTAEGARSLSAQSGADHLLADAGWRSAMRSLSRCSKAAASRRWSSPISIPAASWARCSNSSATSCIPARRSR